MNDNATGAAAAAHPPPPLERLVTADSGGDLPAFIRRRDGRLELVLHCTGIQTLKVCPRKFHLAVGLEIERAVPRWSLNYGGAIHEALAHRYANLGLSLKEVERQQLDRLTAWFAR